MLHDDIYAGAIEPVLTRKDALLRHLINAIEGARFEVEPYCHLLLRNAFPASVYRDMVAKVPDRSLCTPFNIDRYKRSNGKSVRDEFHFSRASLATLPPEAAALWTNIITVLMHPDFKRAVFSKMAPDLALRFGISRSEVPDIECRYKISISRESDSYRLQPHPDGLNKIVSLMFYLPKDDSCLELGTSVYRKRGGLFRLLPGKFDLPGMFEEVRRAPFLPNSGLAFAVSESKARTSWHGVEKIERGCEERTIMHMFFVKKGPLPD